MQLIIFGGGRWAQEICKEANKLSILKKIIIITNNKNLKIKDNKKKIIILNNFSLNSLTNKSKIIISNNAKDHFKTLKKIIRFKNEILIEKPLFTSFKHLNFIKFKKNIFFSRIWSFDKYLELFSNKINKNKIHKVYIHWYDSVNEMRHNQIKKHDLKIRYSIDIFSHLMNLIEIIVKKKIQLINNFKIKKNNKDESIFSITFKGIIFDFKISRIKKRRKRYIKVIDLKKNIHEINFSRDNLILRKNNSKTYLHSYRSEGNLGKMIKCFLYKKQIKKLNINYGIDYLKLHNKIFN